jgi:hypothetical protein
MILLQPVAPRIKKYQLNKMPAIDNNILLIDSGAQDIASPTEVMVMRGTAARRLQRLSWY